MGDARELATAYVAIVPSAKGIAASLNRELGAPVEAAAAQSGARASAALTGRFAAGSKTLAKTVRSAFIGGLVVVAALGGGALKLGNDFKTAYNTIRVETGATGKSFDGLKDDFKAVLSQRPEGMQAVAQAVSKLHQGLDLTGPSLQEMAKQTLRLSSITKTDLSANISTVTKLFNNWGVAAAAQPKKLDELFRASQATGISVADLGAAMARMGSPLRQLGFSFEDSAAMLGLLDKAGVDAGSIMPALSKTIAAAAKEGKSARSVFKGVFDEIRRAPTDTAAAGAAIKVFGARAGPNLAGLIRQGKLSFEDLSKTISSGGDTIAKAAEDTAGFSGKFKIFLNQLRVAVEPIAIATVTFAISAMTAAGPYLQRFADIVHGATVRVAAFFAANPGAKFAVLASIIGVLLGGAVLGLASKLAFLFSPTTLIIGAIIGVAAGAIYAYKHVESFRHTVDRVAAAVIAFATAAAPKLRAAFSAIVGFAGQLIARLRQIDFAAIFARVAEIVGPVIGGLRSLGSAVAVLAVAALPALVATFNNVRAGFAFLVKISPPVIAAFYVLARVAGVVVGAALKVIGVAVRLVASHMAQLRPVLLAVLAGFVALKVARGTVAVFQTIASSARSTVAAVRGVGSSLAGTASKVTGFFKAGGGKDTLTLRFWAVRDAVKNAASSVARGVSSVARWGKQALISAASTVKQVAALVAQKVAAFAAAAAQKAMAAAQWLLNAAMDANPIGLVVIAVAAFVAGIVLAYNKIGPFRDLVNAAFGLIKGVIVGVFDWVTGHWPLILAVLTGPIGLAVLFVTRHWSTIKAVFAGVFNWIRSHWPLILAILTGPIGIAVLVITRHWDTIKAAFTAVKTWIGARVSDIVGFITAIPKRIGGTFTNLWHGLTAGISAAKRWVGERIEDIVGILTRLPGRLANTFGGMFDGIKNAFRSAINFVIDGWNGLQFKIPGFDPPGPGPKFGGFTLGVPNIPRLEGGGLVTSPTVALLGESSKARPEIASPVAQLRSVFRDELDRGDDHDRRRGGLTVEHLEVHEGTEANTFAALQRLALRYGL